MMNLRNFKLIIKHLGKNKLFTAVTFLGFTVSLMFIILLSTYVKQELSVDQFNKNKDRIYRLGRENGFDFAHKLGPDLYNMLPEIKNYCALFKQQGIFSWHDTKVHFNYLVADSSFFSIFSFKMVEGNKHQVLKSEHSVVLSKSFARKIFKDKSPIGEQVSFSGQKYIVSGIMEDIPDDTHIQKSDAIINFNAMATEWGDSRLLTSYDNNSFGIYFLAKKNTDLPSEAPQVLDFLKKNHWMYHEGYAKTVFFQPLRDVYFSKIEMSGTKTNSRVLIKVLSAITLLILILAMINYANLTIAQSVSTSKDMALRRLMGSSRGLLIWNSIKESTFLCFVSAIAAVILSLLAEPVFNSVFNTNIHLEDKFTLPFLLLLLLLTIIVGTISGSLPALAISRFNPIEIVKGTIRRNNNVSLSKVMVAFQYSAVIALLICSLLIFKQTRFMENKDIGFNKDNLVWLENYMDNQHRQAFANEVKKIPGVRNIGFVRFSPLEGGNNESFVYQGRPLSFQVFYFDSAFIKMSGLAIRPTDAAYSPDGIYVNETGIKALELDKDQTSFKMYGRTIPILGIVKDFNFKPLRKKIGPAFIFQLSPGSRASQIFIKISQNANYSTLNNIRKLYRKFSNGIPAKINFADETVNHWYIKESRTSKIIGYFTLLSIAISVMGILALSIFYLQDRIKEIGIRKVNGARTGEVVSMLNGEFVKWVIVAFIIASPIAWYAMHKWLENFAYKTDLSWWIFALAGILALALALLTVSFQSWRAATRNPVEALRYE